MIRDLEEIKFSSIFNKQLKKAPLKIKVTFRKRINLFLKDEFSPILNSHTLTGEYKGYRSINITGDWRAIYSVDLDNNINFELLGTHSQLYR